MRDPNRIKTFCDELAKIWEENCPDWRFGQLVGNVLSDYDVSTFYMEDDEMIKGFKNFFNSAQAEQPQACNPYFEKKGDENE